jgi:hypothetical protein
MPSTAADRIAADKRAQEKESAERDNSRRGESDAVALDRETELAAAEGAEEALAEDAEQGRRAPSRDGERDPQRKEPPPRRLTPGDDKRKNMFERFRSDRNAEAKNSNNADEELLAFAHQGLPPELADQEKQPLRPKPKRPPASRSRNRNPRCRPKSRSRFAAKSAN